MSTRKVLLICYYFPPLGGAGVGRPLALYKHLPEHGWACHILTVKRVTYRAYEPELLDNLPREYIYRAGSTDPQRLMFLLGARKVTPTTIERGRAISNRFFPDPKVGWVRFAVRLGRTLITNHNYDAIISTSPPISSHLAGRQLASEFHIPWIADFRDYWTIYPVEKTYHHDHKKIKRGQYLLQEIKEKATTITAINSSIGQYVGAEHIIYNSFDKELAERWKLPTHDGNFVIGVLGTLNEVYPIEPLLKVLSLLRKQAPNLFEKIRVLQIGSVDRTWLQKQLEQYHLDSQFEIKQFQKRTATIDLLSSTALLYIGLSSEQAKSFSTGRIYTMLSSGRPILAAAPPEGEVEQLVKESGNGFCFFDGTEEYAVSYVQKQVEQFLQGNNIVQLQPEYARKYASDMMASQFAKVLNTIISS